MLLNSVLAKLYNIFITACIIKPQIWHYFSNYIEAKFFQCKAIFFLKNAKKFTSSSYEWNPRNTEER